MWDGQKRRGWWGGRVGACVVRGRVLVWLCGGGVVLRDRVGLGVGWVCGGGDGELWIRWIESMCASCVAHRKQRDEGARVKPDISGALIHLMGQLVGLLADRIA